MRGTLALWIGAALALGACAKSQSPSVGGETNWLVRCSDDASCEIGSCLCGVCSRACDERAVCGGDFAGSCTSSKVGAGGALCAQGEQPQGGGLCLPRCDTEQACGERFSCQDGVCVPGRSQQVPVDPDGGPPDAGGGAAASGGAGGTAGSAIDGCVPGPDSGCGPAPGAGPLLARLAQSRAAWDALAADRGETYWYEEQNCVVNVVGGGGQATVVQVEDGVVRDSSTRSIDACVVSVNRYGVLAPTRTMTELYEMCAELVSFDGSAVTITTDEQGVIKSCSGEEESPTCFDACGYGFALSEWAFGYPDPGSDAGAR